MNHHPDLSDPDAIGLHDIQMRQMENERKMAEEKAVEESKAEEKVEQPIVVSKEDCLELEVAQLKLMNARANIQTATVQLEALERDAHRLNNMNLRKLEEVAAKYGFSPSSTFMDPETGLVTPRPPAQPIAPGSPQRR